ncbi:MAG: ArsA family ATPase, partial [Gammaproteobacteria bacterium]
GGVGKTTVSSATAVALAGEGARVLLVSTDPAHNLGHLFDREIGDKPVRLAAGLDGLELDPSAVVEAHLSEVTRALYELMPVTSHKDIDRHMALSRDAPGMHEAALLERMADVAEQGAKDYDHVIFDTAPSGHTARLMVLPEMMSAWTEGLIKRREKADRFAEFVRELGSDNSMADKTVKSGQSSEEQRETRIRQILNRRRLKFNALRDRLADEEQTAFIVVLAAERLPVLETVELYHQLQESGIGIGGMVVNKRLPDESGEFLAERRGQELVYLQYLERQLPGVPRMDLYLVAQDVVGLGALEQLAKQL